MTNPIKRLASEILAAAARHNNSFDHEAARIASVDAGSRGHLGFIDFNRFYRLPLHEACQGEFGRPIFLMLSSNWNKSLDWARDELSVKFRDVPIGHKFKYRLRSEIFVKIGSHASSFNGIPMPAYCRPDADVELIFDGQANLPQGDEPEGPISKEIGS